MDADSMATSSTRVVEWLSVWPGAFLPDEERLKLGGLLTKNWHSFHQICCEGNGYSDVNDRLMAIVKKCFTIAINLHESKMRAEKRVMLKACQPPFEKLEGRFKLRASAFPNDELTADVSDHAGKTREDQPSDDSAIEEAKAIEKSVQKRKQLTVDDCVPTMKFSTGTKDYYYYGYCGFDSDCGEQEEEIQLRRTLLPLVSIDMAQVVRLAGYFVGTQTLVYFGSIEFQKQQAADRATKQAAALSLRDPAHSFHRLKVAQGAVGLMCTAEMEYFMNDDVFYDLIYLSVEACKRLDLQPFVSEEPQLQQMTMFAILRQLQPNVAMSAKELKERFYAICARLGRTCGEVPCAKVDATSTTTTVSAPSQLEESALQNSICRVCNYECNIHATAEFYKAIKAHGLFFEEDFDEKRTKPSMTERKESGNVSGQSSRSSSTSCFTDAMTAVIDSDSASRKSDDDASTEENNTHTSSSNSEVGSVDTNLTASQTLPDRDVSSGAILEGSLRKSTRKELSKKTAIQAASAYRTGRPRRFCFMRVQKERVEEESAEQISKAAATDDTATNATVASANLIDVVATDRAALLALPFRARKENLYVPCDHVGTACGLGVPGCFCFPHGLRCEKFCSCYPDCMFSYYVTIILGRNTFPGCHCQVGRCQANRCVCFAESRECDPERCKCYHGRGPHENGVGCLNVKVRLGLIKKLVVKPSEIEGLGLFAGEHLRFKDFIGCYTGEVITEAEGMRRTNEYTRNYFFDFVGDYVVDGQYYGNHTRFANHSSTAPNLAARIITVDGTQHVAIFANRSIEFGEELLLDYGIDPEELYRYVGDTDDGAAAKKVGRPSVKRVMNNNVVTRSHTGSLKRTHKYADDEYYA